MIRPLLLAALACLALLLPGSSAYPATPATEPHIVFEGTTVTATGLPPGAEVAWLAVWRERVAEASTHVTRIVEVSGDEDRDGEVRLDLDRPVPLVSVWIAVDTRSGSGAMATPEGFHLRLLPQERRRVRGDQRELEAQVANLTLLLVRPGEGAWSVRARDEARNDRDLTADGTVRVALADFHPWGPTTLRRLANSCPATSWWGSIPGPWKWSASNSDHEKEPIPKAAA